MFGFVGAHFDLFALAMFGLFACALGLTSIADRLIQRR